MPSIDLEGVQRSLGMSRAAEDLGYAEERFDTCRIGYGYSSTRDCRVENLVVIHFLLQCRDSEGTVSEALGASDVQPVSADRIRWNLGKREGMTRTDGEGYGQVRLIAPVSQKGEKLRLTIDGKFLALTASEVSRIVAPGPWCRR